METSTTFEGFLRQCDTNQQDDGIHHIAVGNAAGDADSIISALTYGYIESVFGSTTTDKKKIVPIVSISKQDLKTQRPEVSFLFQTLGMDDAVVDSMRFIDDPILTRSRSDTKTKLTLLDHNRAQGIFENDNYQVVEILDHHFDEEQHAETCSGDQRQVAFENDSGKALVASTCTLVAERWKALRPPPQAEYKCHPTVATLLLGTILLDSVNMIPAAGKGTPRDAAAIQDLLEHADWSTLVADNKAAVAAWWPDKDSSDSKPDTTRIFESLQAAKFDPTFWNSLSVQDALRLDYKQFSVASTTTTTTTTTTTPMSFGASAILTPMKDFLAKPNAMKAIQQYMTQQHVSVEFLAILFFYTNDSGNHRQLMLCGINNNDTTNVVNDMAKYLQADGTLQLKEHTDSQASSSSEEYGWTARMFDQRNTKASRKQVAPLMIQCFESR